ncbi:Nif3-like dinuclear metal center hexameric protein [Arcobacter sp. FWKO B]|uniref:Nif3-like dinuclear metal center hexameric protein n=1 Tax=Arcobacter sp. FWKO B TaxID=2593672 RepID=UPI0018A54EBF|nr:Nif3-like dinuclear metal center hexameric protein [Arcobacter sp. FWKO B]QOG12723.1 Nif3-like dinuclear metal center hexameric protein [Arcobacter sp. FWKO B]
MKVSEIYEVLNTISSFDIQEKWDNSGLNVGSLDSEIENIFISLDIDMEFVNSIPNNSLIITHHPLMITAINTFNFNDRSSKLLKELIKKDISLISMHTNIDITHLNNYFVQDVLGLEISSKEDFIAYCDCECSLEDLITQIKSKISVDILKFVKASDTIKKIAITTGSGMSLLKSVKADCFLTGDIKYHDALEAKEMGISLIDIGHYDSEKYFVPLLMELLSKNLKINEIVGIIAPKDFKNPFNYN